MGTYEYPENKFILRNKKYISIILVEKIPYLKLWAKCVIYTNLKAPYSSKIDILLSKNV